MEEQISRFPKEFDFEPVLENEQHLATDRSVVICGMGGSHLGARLLSRDPACPPLVFHSDYGLPDLPTEWLSSSLFIASSYSGETEETLDSAMVAYKKGYAVAVIASGGALLSFAKEKNLPYITLPNEDLEPRMAVGYQMLALSRILGNTALTARVKESGKGLDLAEAKAAGIALSEVIGERYPVFYASSMNAGLAYHLKADMNETAKMPSAYNIVPELCHNELSGYELEHPALIPIFLEDTEDDPRIARRMTLMKEMLREHLIETGSLRVRGNDGLTKALRIVLIGAYAGEVIAKRRGVEDAKTPLIAEFKRRLHE